MNKQVSYGHGARRDSATALLVLTLAFETAAGNGFSLAALRRTVNQAEQSASGIQVSCGAWTAAGKVGLVEKESAVQSHRSETQQGCAGPGAGWGIPPAGMHFEEAGGQA